MHTAKEEQDSSKTGKTSKKVKVKQFFRKVVLHPSVLKFLLRLLLEDDSSDT